MTSDISPFAPDSYCTCPEISGIRLATAEAGIRYSGRHDVLLAIFDRPTAAAGVFTQSLCPSAPVVWCRDRIGRGEAAALLVNSGNANAFTGKRGVEATRLSADLVAGLLGCGADDVFLASTGVIGEPLEADKFAGVLENLQSEARPDRYFDAARAIMTTDTYPKLATRHVDVGEHSFRLNGIAKGSGMIAPDMATMLAFVFTDAPLAAPVLQTLLSRAVDVSFNAITVDSDTSTSDTVMVFAQPPAGVPVVDAPDHAVAQAVGEALVELCTELAQGIVKDGEGASKFVEIRVMGARSDASAKRIALSIANSPLVKTAIAGEDANWGRVVMAVGKAGEPADRDQLAIWFGDIRVAVDGERDPNYDEADVSAYMKADDILVSVDVGVGDGTARVWTCDLTKTYISINADYRS
ncbi:MAG: bifunctional glutamate N-acetyltransferase/amino-acid acetyltransferase ArgJ [Pseudomonadota bacterium]